MGGALVPVDASDFLTEEQMELVIAELYLGNTLLTICAKHGMRRSQVDLSARRDPDFGKALVQAKSACGDVQAELVEQMLGELYREIPTDRSVSQRLKDIKDSTERAKLRQKLCADNRQLRMYVLRDLANHYRWMADRGSKQYRRKQADKPEDPNKSKTIDTHVPRPGA